LFIVETVLFINCLRQKLRRYTRYLVIVIMMTEIIANVALIGSVVWNCTVLGPKARTTKFLPLGYIAKGITGLLEHFYLITRFYHMSKNIPLTLILAILTLAQFGDNLAGAGFMLKNIHLPPPRSVHYNATMIGWSLGAAVDILVAVGLVWQLLRMDVIFTSTKSMIRKFLVCTVVSGGLTALYGVLLLILFPLSPGPHIVLAQNTGKIYAITVFANLAVLHSLQRPTTVIVGESLATPGSVKLPASSGYPPTTAQGTQSSKSDKLDSTNASNPSPQQTAVSHK